MFFCSRALIKSIFYLLLLVWIRALRLPLYRTAAGHCHPDVYTAVSRLKMGICFHIKLSSLLLFGSHSKHKHRARVSHQKGIGAFHFDLAFEDLGA